jgi:hypothetical protein
MSGNTEILMAGRNKYMGIFILGAFPVLTPFGAPKGVSTGNRAIRSNKKPGPPEWSLGLCPKLRKHKTVRFFVPLLSLALPKNGIHAIFGLWVFAKQKPKGFVQAGIHAGHVFRGGG